MGNMGMPTHLKLSAGAFQQSNLAAITDAISVITEVIKTTRSDDLPIDTLQDSQVGICIAEFGRALSLYNWADLPNDVCPLTSGSIQPSLIPYHHLPILEFGVFNVLKCL
jgi:hypothetical protein